MMSAKSSRDSHIHSVVFSGTDVRGMSWTEGRMVRACGEGSVWVCACKSVCVCFSKECDWTALAALKPHSS